MEVVPKKKTYLFALATGAGKSSLLNAVLDGSHLSFCFIYALISDSYRR